MLRLVLIELVLGQGPILLVNKRIEDRLLRLDLFFFNPLFDFFANSLQFCLHIKLLYQLREVLHVILVVHLRVLLKDNKLVDRGVALQASLLLEFHEGFLGLLDLLGQGGEPDVTKLQLVFVLAFLLVGRLDPDHHRFMHRFAPL